MPAYVIAMMTIHDAETYSKYTDRTPSIVKKYGGKFLTRGEGFTCVEGKDYDGRLVILEYPSKADVEAWYNDSEASGGQNAVNSRARSWRLQINLNTELKENSAAFTRAGRKGRTS